MNGHTEPIKSANNVEHRADHPFGVVNKPNGFMGSEPAAVIEIESNGKLIQML